MEQSQAATEDPGSASRTSQATAAAGQFTNRSGSSLRMGSFSFSQIAAGIWVLGAIAWIVFSGSPGAWIALLSPSIVACVWLLFRSESLTAWVERREEGLRAAVARVAIKTGKISKYFSRPLCRGSLWIWEKAGLVADRHLRAGLRVGALLYFSTAMITIGAFVGYIVVAVLFVIAVVLLIFWIAGKMSGDAPDLDGPGRGLPGLGGLRPARSRPSRDFLGNPKTDHFDEKNKRVAESRFTTDLLGNRKEEIFTTNDKKIVERRPSVDCFGDPKIDECNAQNEKTGESRAGVDWLGDPVEKHFDKDNKQLGESRPDTDLLGNPIVRHEWKDPA